MKIRLAAALAALSCLALQGASAAPLADSNWIGAWGYTALPLPPGQTPAQTVPVVLPAMSPLGDYVPVQAPPPVPPAQPLVDNPGNVPLVVTNTDITNVTLRQLVRVAVAGKRLRLRFSNENGVDAMALGAVRIAAAGPDGSIAPGSDHAVTFDGHAGVTIPAGAPLLSDPVAMPVKTLDKLLISIYVPGAVPKNGHGLWQYVSSTAGDSTAQPQLPGARLMRATSLVTEVEVDPVTADSVVVALGDSITEGAQSTSNAFRGWPDRLAERLAASSSGRKWSVVNAGIGGNRLLRYGTGPNVLARLDRDVLSVPGVKVVILLEGINDIGRGFTPATASTEPVTAEGLEAADKQIILRAHAHGIKVIGATLTPYEGAAYFDPKGEVVREALNQWIMTSGAFDGVVDFAAVTADPAHVTTFRPGFNLRDHLHPNDDGYKAMGDAIDLKLITGR